VSVPRCPKRCCGAVLIERPGPFGQLDWVCVPCEVNKAGFCRGCPNRLNRSAKKHGFKMFCDACLTRREKDRDRRRYWDEDTGRRRARKERYQRDVCNAEWYAARLATERERYDRTRRGKPRDNFERAYDRAFKRRRRAGAARVTVDRRKKVAA
jgi:hypothetical protein